MPKNTSSISVTEFKAKCLKILRQVEDEQVTYIITKHKKVVAELRPINAGSSQNPLENSIKYEKDLVSPIEENWNCEK